MSDLSSRSTDRSSWQVGYQPDPDDPGVPPQGFQAHGPEGVLVPVLLKERLDKEHLDAALQHMLETQARERALSEERAKRSASNTPARKPGEYDIAAESKALGSTTVSEWDPQIAHQVIDPQSFLRLIDKTLTSDRDSHGRNTKLYEALKPKGSLRQMATGSEADSGLNKLESSMPHFRAVVEFVRTQIQLSWERKDGLRIPPILLAGGPGLGKTHFAQELAKVLETTYRVVGMDSDVSNSLLLGSDKKWSNSHTGLLFETIVLGSHANPVIVLDELDKANRRQDTDPLASLHSLLEPVSAARVRDISVDLEFDASKVIWIATANFLPRLDQPLRSRFREFWIEQPMGEDAIQMALAIVESLLPQLAPEGFAQPERSLVVKLAHLTAREIYQALEEAFGRAVVNGRKHLLVSDLPADLLDASPQGKYLH